LTAGERKGDVIMVEVGSFETATLQALKMEECMAHSSEL
jgi:hypothetical protein